MLGPLHVGTVMEHDIHMTPWIDRSPYHTCLLLVRCRFLPQQLRRRATQWLVY